MFWFIVWPLDNPVFLALAIRLLGPRLGVRCDEREESTESFLFGVRQIDGHASDRLAAAAHSSARAPIRRSRSVASAGRYRPPLSPHGRD